MPQESKTLLELNNALGIEIKPLLELNNALGIDEIKPYLS